MRIAIVGSGAIGGLLGLKLSKAAAEIVFVDRGERLEAMRRAGLTLLSPSGDESLSRIRATDDFQEAGVQDYVILAVKSHQLAQVAPFLGPLCSPRTTIVTVQNGLPWWYFQRFDGPLQGTRLTTLDPDGVLERCIPARQVVGCVAYPAAEMIRPGVIKHVEGDSFPLGELDGSASERCSLLCDRLQRAGLRSRVLPDIRDEIWLKAWGTLCFNPVSALTRATMASICNLPETRELASKMMLEAQTVAGKLGVRFRHTLERRLAGAANVGEHKTSMLQDVESGAPLELEALVGSVLEIARMTDTPTPAIETVYACTKLLDRTVCCNAGLTEAVACF